MLCCRSQLELSKADIAAEVFLNSSPINHSSTGHVGYNLFSVKLPGIGIRTSEKQRTNSWRVELRPFS